MGEGHPVLMIHGSGPGVSGFVNWRLAMPELARHCRVIAPDMLGFGYSDRAADGVYSAARWVDQAVGLMDALGVEQTDIVGNSFGVRWP
jgi:2-hydroxymuconate-semialdehyde hydrolase